MSDSGLTDTVLKSCYLNFLLIFHYGRKQSSSKKKDSKSNTSDQVRIG